MQLQLDSMAWVKIVSNWGLFKQSIVGSEGKGWLGAGQKRIIEVRPWKLFWENALKAGNSC